EESALCFTFQFLEGGADERVAGAEVVVEEVERGADGEGVQPEADLGEFHGHRVEIDAVDASLQHVAAKEVDVRQLHRIDADALFVQGVENALPGAVEG